MAHGTYLYSSSFYNLLFFTTAVGIPKYTEAIALPLFLLLSLKLILQGSNLWNRTLATFLDLAIYPLLFLYGIVVIFKVANVVAQNYPS